MTSTTAGAPPPRGTPAVPPAVVARLGGAPRRGRDVSVDLLRGYLVLVIVVDHLGRFPSAFDAVTGRAGLWATAAEGFFLVSGAMVGLVTAHRAVRDGEWAATRALLRRALLLYALFVTVTLASTLAGRLAPGPGLLGGIAPVGTPWSDVVASTLTLHYRYGWADYLAYYAVFVAAAPVALAAARRGLAWLLLAGSLLLWHTAPTLGPPGLQLGAWQLLFVLGLVGGLRLRGAEAWLLTRPARLQMRLLASLLGAAAATLTLSVLTVFAGLPLGPLQGFSDAVLADRFAPSAGRVAVACLWVSALYVGLRLAEERARAALGWLLLPLGRWSLRAYVSHAVVVFGMHAWLIRDGQWGWSGNTLLAAVAVGAVWAAVVTLQALPQAAVPARPTRAGTD